MIRGYAEFKRSGAFFETGAGLINLSGEKSASLLQGQLSNDINALGPGRGNYNLLLTIRGSVAAGLHVFNTGSSFVLLTDPGCLDTVRVHFEKYAGMVGVTLAVVDEGLSILHACGPSEGVLEGIAAVPAPLYRSDRWGYPGCDIPVPREKAGEIKTALLEAGLFEGDALLRETLRVEMGVPLYGQDATVENIPQESRLDRALDFKKGCYFGQEVVARVHFRGHAAKVLVGLKSEGAEPFGSGAQLYDADKELGRITSSVASPKLGAILSLGYVPYESREPGTKIEAGPDRVPVEVVSLPL